MKIQRQNTVGFTVPILVYSIDEVNADPVLKEALVREGINNLIYRSVLPTARGIVAEAVSKATGIAREFVPVMKQVKTKGEDGQEIVTEVQATNEEGPMVETKLDDADHIKLAMAKSGMSVEQIQPTIDEMCNTYENKDENNKVVSTGLQVDYRVKERTAPKPKVLPAKFLDAANKFISAGKVVAFGKAYQKLVGKPLDAAATTDATKLGWALREYSAAQEAATLAV